MKHLTDEQISELLDGFLLLNQTQNEHLQNCSDCRKRLEEWRNISYYVQNLPLQSAPDAITSKIAYQINAVKNTSYKVRTPSLQWNYKLLATSLAFLFLLIIGISFIYYNYENQNLTNTNTSQSISTIGPVARNDNNYNQNNSITAIEPFSEENILSSISEQYIYSEPFEEDLHEITISELLLSLAEETEEYDISDISL